MFSVECDCLVSQRVIIMQTNDTLIGNHNCLIYLVFPITDSTHVLSLEQQAIQHFKCLRAVNVKRGASVVIYKCKNTISKYFYFYFEIRNHSFLISNL